PDIITTHQPAIDGSKDPRRPDLAHEIDIDTEILVALLNGSDLGDYLHDAKGEARRHVCPRNHIVDDERDIRCIRDCRIERDNAVIRRPEDVMRRSNLEPC